jgi:hypothetical protein
MYILHCICFVQDYLKNLLNFFLLLKNMSITATTMDFFGNNGSVSTPVLYSSVDGFGYIILELQNLPNEKRTNINVNTQGSSSITTVQGINGVALLSAEGLGTSNVSFLISPVQGDGIVVLKYSGLTTSIMNWIITVDLITILNQTIYVNSLARSLLFNYTNIMFNPPSTTRTFSFTLTNNIGQQINNYSLKIAGSVGGTQTNLTLSVTQISPPTPPTPPILFTISGTPLLPVLNIPTFPANASFSCKVTLTPKKPNPNVHMSLGTYIDNVVYQSNIYKS